MSRTNPPSPRAVTEVDTEIGQRLRERRGELGVPQAHVAELVGITFQQLQKYEAGENRVSAATLLRLADALHMDAADLLPNRKRAARAKAATPDGMSLQLQHAFNQIRSPRERKLVLDMARRLAADAPGAKPRRKATR